MVRSRLSRRAAGTDRRKHKPDYGLVVVVGILLLLGLIIIFAVSPALVQRDGAESLLGGEYYYFLRQLIAVCLGIIAFIFMAITPINFWEKVQPLLVVSAVALSVIILIPGVGQEINGARRWINVGPVSLQPSEFVKLALVFYLASLLSQRIRKDELDDTNKTLKPLLYVTFALAILIAVLQKDLGTMVSVVAITVFMYFMSGAAMRNISIYLGSIGAAAVAAVILFPHRMERVLTFLNPATDAEGAGYHINQALISIGSGGFFGKGLGRSVQVFGYLPEAANDSIFAIIAEVLGFLGTMVVLVLFGILFMRMMKIMTRLENPYLMLLVAGILGWVLSHTIINIGAMLGLLPLTGITLPFLSLGGTSLVMIMAALGLVFNISRYTSLSVNKELNNANSHHWRRDSRSRHSRSSGRR